MGTSTEELSSDIARTRQDLSRDVDALQDKVSPSAIMERRKSALRERFTSMKTSVMGSGSAMTPSASGAGSAIEDRVEGSPLAAGLVAFGAGLVLAGLVPASKAEAQGAQRLKEVAQEHGQPWVDQARSVAQDVGEQLKEKASEAAQEVKASAQESAERVKDEAPGSSDDSGGGLGSGDQAAYRPTGPVV